MSCRHAGRHEPRLLTGRHLADCADEACRGCQPCTDAHCRVCGVIHADGTCGGCMDETRETLAEIVRMCGDLLSEAISKGTTESEAMHLLGPAADPEASGHLRASVLVGRVPADYLEAADNDTHPLWVLGTWEMQWRDVLEHETADLVTIADAADYLDRNMTYMAGFWDLPFEDFARDLRGCEAHLDAVLHDGEQHDRGAPCMTCGTLLERAWDLSGAGKDGWRCPRCKQTSTDEQYRFAVAHLHREEATELTDRDMEIRTGVRAGTVRVWANRDLVHKRRDSGRTLYAVADVMREAALRGLVSR